MQIKRIADDQIFSAIDLIWTTFMQFEAPDYSEEGIQSFRDFIEKKEIANTLEFWGAYDDNELKGVIVNSSPYAVPIYHKLGFVDTDTEQLSDGIRYTPMRFER